MAKDTFEEIHGNAGGTIQSGPDLGMIVGSAEAARAAQDAGGGGGTGGGADANVPMAAPRLSSFSVYYDQSEKTLKMVDPQVFGPDGPIVCGLPEGIADGTYYCNVLKQKSGGTYIAKIETTEANEDGDYKQVCSVKLFTLNGMDFKQFHAGAIFAPGGASDAKKYVAGDDTNIVFTEKKDSEGNATGEIAVDVYYK